MTLKQLEQKAIKALTNAHKMHQELGPNGEEIIHKNRFGDSCLRLDFEAEKAIIEVFEEECVPLRIISEEHGVVEIGETPQYLGILDGLDGSSVFKTERDEGRYGTMLGILSNLNPTYGDYVFSGIMEHSTRKLYYAVKGGKSFVVENGRKYSIHCSSCSRLDVNTRIYIDEYWTINKKIFSQRLKGFNASHTGSSAANYADVASGNADLTLECTRKGNLEIAVAYGLITEAGGTMATLDGVNLGQKHYLTFGQSEHLPVITASTKQLLMRLINYIEEKY